MSLPSLFDDIPYQSGKVIIVTGGNAGIGKVTCKVLVARGAKVYMGARSKERAEEAIEEIKRETGKQNIHWLPLDLSSLSSVIGAAEIFKRQEKDLHVLINNAGIVAVPFGHTKDGYEVQWGTNVVGHFVLIQALLPTLLATASSSGPVRVINITSEGHRYFGPSSGIDFDDLSLSKYWFLAEWKRYGQSKLGNILLTKEIVRRYGDQGIISLAVHPGEIVTQVHQKASQTWGSRFLLWLSSMRAFSVEEGAYTQLFAATHEKIINENWSGNYLVPMGQLGVPCKEALDAKLAEKLWDHLENDVAAKISAK